MKDTLIFTKVDFIMSVQLCFWMFESKTLCIIGNIWNKVGFQKRLPNKLDKTRGEIQCGMTYIRNVLSLNLLSILNLVQRIKIITILNMFQKHFCYFRNIWAYLREDLKGKKGLRSTP